MMMMVVVVVLRPAVLLFLFLLETRQEDVSGALDDLRRLGEVGRVRQRLVVTVPLSTVPLYTVLQLWLLLLSLSLPLLWLVFVLLLLMVLMMLAGLQLLLGMLLILLLILRLILIVLLLWGKGRHEAGLFVGLEEPGFRHQPGESQQDLGAGREACRRRQENAPTPNTAAAEARN